MLALDPTSYNERDVVSTLRSLGTWWAELIRGDDDHEWIREPLRDQLAAITQASSALGVSVVDASDPRITIDRTAKVIVSELKILGWREDVASELLRRSLQAIHAGALARRAAGRMPASVKGTVHRLSTSDGGVPKLAADQIAVSERGVAGDRQASRRVHGSPWQALCLWSLETIEAFQRDGHPIEPGSAGENITVAGIAWADVTAGVRLQIGGVLAEVSMFAPPCTQNAQWFSDGDFRRIGSSRGPGVSRVYASVVTSGQVSVGDTVVLEP